MNFVTIDVETANSSSRAICQIGIAKFVNGVVVEEWVTLINPQDDFDFYSVRTHGINKNHVMESPKFPDILDKLKYFLEDSICVSHGSFDQDALAKAFKKYSIEPLDIRWLDSTVVARQTWFEFSEKGYGLKDLCKKIGYEFKHHDALEDAKAAGKVLLEALKDSELDIHSWLDRLIQPTVTNLSVDATTLSQAKNQYNWAKNGSIKRTGNPKGSLYGEVIVFTGQLTKMTRDQAADLASDTGCKVDENITKKTSFLVFGHQDLIQTKGKDKSGTHLKAESLNLKGHNISILNENQFIELIANARNA